MTLSQRRQRMSWLFTSFGWLTLAVLLGQIGLIQCQVLEEDSKVLVVLLSQKDPYHVSRAEVFEDHLNAQLPEVNGKGLFKKPQLLVSHKDFSEVPSHWRTLPIIERLGMEPNIRKVEWILFCGEETRVNVTLLMSLLLSIDATQELFMGRPLCDDQTIATVVKNFAIDNMPQGFLYPDVDSGFLINAPVIRRVLHKLRKESYTEWSQHPSLEFAAVVWDRDRGVALQGSPKFCGVRNTWRSPCITWISSAFPQCPTPEASIPGTGNLFVAVKTCGKYHKDRIPAVKATWAKEAEHLELYSDVADTSIPTTTLGVNNTNRGHCGKTMAIMRHIAYSPTLSHIPWVLLADDDTIIYLNRLTSLLSCYNSSQMSAIGEIYSYGTPRRGYEFHVGGSGIVLSQPVVRLLADNCKCYADDGSDDLVLGMCLKAMGVTLTHSRFFHQARPRDYSSAYLANQLPVSFHKHIDVDPVQIYHDLKTWQREDLRKGHTKEEL